MPEDKVRVRFAPAPTGFLHVGGARTALFNWLFARQKGGSFILRIEDTDAEKSSEEMARAIVESLLWLGLDWDEGPYYQSQNIQKHREAVGKILAGGGAYRCFCPREVAEAGKRMEMEMGRPAVYPGTCRALGEEEVREKLEADEPHVVRFLAPPGETSFTDGVYGGLSFDNATIGDFVLLRADGSPTYNLAVVIDDAGMGVTHVIRGDDHLSNTPKQILLYQALGLTPPVFAHLPLILGSDKQRLSKRHGAVSVGVYREEGVLPEALFNFLALLGWSPGDDREVMSREEIIRSFSLERVIKKSAVFDPAKLEWMNSQYFSACPADRLVELVTPLLESSGWFDLRYLAERGEWYRKVLLLLRERAHRLGDFLQHGKIFFTDEFDYDPEAVAKRWKSPSTIEHLERTREALIGLDEFTVERTGAAIRDQAEKMGVSAAQLIHPLRVAVSGKAVGPGLFELLELVGREKTIERIDRAISYLKAHPA